MRIYNLFHFVDGIKLHMLMSKLYGGTSKTKAGQGALVRVALFWKSHCATCLPACVILYHVTGSCKGPIECVHCHAIKNKIKKHALDKVKKIVIL